MDYEKAYKESFGVAKCLHETGDVITKKQMERLFPQLAESEDERIRKGLIEALKTSKAVGELKFVIPEPTREECLAYLEKQKEQKPTEWSDEDSRMLSDIAGYISGVGSSSGTTKRERVDFLYELPKRFNLQPKQEWSEEDKRCFDEAIECLENLNFDGHASNLKILRDFRKPLNTWKPSEKQMKALYSALNDANDAISLYSNKVFPLYEEISRKRFDTLESLYNDLKKLM